MSKDTLILAFLLTGFACLGFGCDERDNPADDARLPHRADAANPLLRHYYDTNTFPSEMGAWKVPEGDSFKDEELEMRFSMSGGEVVNDVRVRLFLVNPPQESNSAPEVRCRVEAPDGTKSAWEEVSFVTGNGSSGEVDHNAEVIFNNDFDGIISSGIWKVLLRDPVEDEDGRCLLRNGTLRINGGQPAGSVGGNESVVLQLDQAPYDRRLPEVKPPRSDGDFGYVGARKPVNLKFTFATLFSVSRIQFTFALRQFGPAAASDVRVCVTSPSGGWLIFALSDSNSTGQATGISGDTFTTYALDIDSADPGLGQSFYFLGEPSAGTWRIYLWEINDDGAGIYLAPEGITLVPAPDPMDPPEAQLVPFVPASMTLS